MFTDAKVKPEPLEPHIHQATQPPHEVIEILDSDEELILVQGKAKGKGRVKAENHELREQTRSLYVCNFFYS